MGISTRCVVLLVVFSVFTTFPVASSAASSQNAFSGGSDIQQFVSIAVTGLEVEELDSLKMEMKVRLEIEQSWTEMTLQNFTSANQFSRNTLLDESNRTKFWTPEVLVQNGREVVRTRNAWNLDPQGRHTLRDKIAVRFGCLLSFSMYPFDHQRCRLELSPLPGFQQSASWSYKLGGGDAPLLKTDATIFASPFSIVDTSAALRDTSSGALEGQAIPDSSVLIIVHVRRSWSAYFGSYFLPTSSFVFISLLTLWLVYPKISVIVNFLNIILANIFLLLHRNSLDIPKVYYVTAMSVYSFTSLIFIVCVLLVNVYVLYYIKAEEEDDEEKARRRRPHDLNIRNDIKFVPPPNTSSITTTSSNHMSTFQVDDDSSSGSRRDAGQTLSTWILIKRKVLDRIRRNSHWALLVTFLLFNFVYWVLMLTITYTQ